MPLRRLAAALVLVFAVHAGWIVSTGLADAPRAADVAVVLGTTALPDGRLSDRLEARTSAALALYRDGLVRRVLVSGATGSEGVNEAEAMARGRRRRGHAPRAHAVGTPRIVVNRAGDSGALRLHLPRRVGARRLEAGGCRPPQRPPP